VECSCEHIGFNKMLVCSSVAVQLAASQEELKLHGASQSVLYLSDRLNKFHTMLIGMSCCCSVGINYAMGCTMHNVQYSVQTDCYPTAQDDKSDEDSPQPIIWRYISTPSHIFMAWCLIKHKKNNFYFKFH
jgi:hypothetical protein